MKTRLVVYAALLCGMLALTGCSGVNALLTQVTGLAVQAQPEVSGDSARGAEIFRTSVNGAPPCAACHQVVLDAVGFSLAPNLAGIAAHAPERIAAMTPEQYIQDSILHPTHYVVSGYHVSMFDAYESYLSPQDIADLTAYLLTL